MAVMAARPRGRRLTGARIAEWAGAVLTYLLLTIAAILVLAPFVWLFSTSLRLPAVSFRLPPKWLPTDWYIQNYRTVFKTVPFGRFFFNSVFIAAMVVVGQLIFASMAAFAFARLRFPAKNLLFGLLMAALMIPIQATVIPVFVIISKLHLANTLWSLILPGWASAFGVFLLRQYFLTIPNELMEAARLDGANFWQIYWLVMLPLCRPALVVLAILTFNGYWNEYFRPLIFLNTPDKFTLPLGLVTLNGNLGSGSVAVVLAGVMLSLIPVLFLYIFTQRYLVEGITATGIKG